MWYTDAPMLGIGFWELVVIAILALLAVGPDRLPSMVKTVIRFYRQIQRSADELRDASGLNELMQDEELKELLALRQKKLALLDLEEETAKAKAAPTAKASPSPKASEPVSEPVSTPANAPVSAPSNVPLDDDDAMIGAAVPASLAAVGSVAVLAAARKPALDVREEAREIPIEGVDLALARSREPAPKDEREPVRAREAAGAR